MILNLGTMYKMRNFMAYDESELKEFIKSVLNAVSETVTGNYSLGKHIELELAVISKKKAEGGFKIVVAEAGGKYC
jgi:hypothetical protein